MILPPHGGRKAVQGHERGLSMRPDAHSRAGSALNRRDFLRAVALGGGAAWLAACQSAPAAPSGGSGGRAATAAGQSAAAGAVEGSGEGEEWRALLAAARQ